MTIWPRAMESPEEDCCRHSLPICYLRILYHTMTLPFPDRDCNNSVSKSMVQRPQINEICTIASAMPLTSKRSSLFFSEADGEKTTRTAHPNISLHTVLTLPPISIYRSIHAPCSATACPFHNIPAKPPLQYFLALLSP
jgi:hypothetical protein